MNLNNNSNEIKQIALIDADSLIYYSALKNKENPASLDEAIIEINNRINDILEKTNSSHYILFLSYGKKTFRHKLATIAPYKGNRINTVLPPVFVGLKEYIKQKPSFICEDFEADDGVSLFKTYFESLKNSIKTIICSPDKDVLNQIEGVHFNYNKNLIVATSKKDAEKFLYLQVLMGDPTDNVKGIPKVGIKTALNYLKKSNNYINTCVDKYIEKFGVLKGVNYFTENLNLVYILKTDEDLLESCGYNLSTIDIYIKEYILAFKKEIIW